MANFDLSMIETNFEPAQYEQLSQNFDIPIFTTSSSEALAQYAKSQQQKLANPHLFTLDISITSLTPINTNIFFDLPAATHLQGLQQVDYFSFTGVIFPIVIIVIVECLLTMCYMFYRIYQKERKQKWWLLT